MEENRYMPTINQNNWKVDYSFSTSSGLRLGLCEFKGSRVLHRASVPFIYVNYSGPWGPFTDRLKSNSGDITVREIMNGFDIKVSYDYYGEDYQYDHIWRFHDDGQFGSSIVIQGPGEENNGMHTYHIPFRYDLDINGAAGDSFQHWVPLSSTSGYWTDELLEGRYFPPAINSDSYDWQVVDKSTNKRAMIRSRNGDNAEVWPLQYSSSEDWRSWGGTQAGAPGSPGSVPAIYANDQSIQNTNLVVWYIAHVPSRDLVACCGPWFKLMGF